MDQTHIGYTSWQQPDKDSMPEVKKISLPDKAIMGIAIEGSDKWWPEEKTLALLPTFDWYSKEDYYIEIFNRGKVPFDYKITADKSWVMLSGLSGRIEKETRISVLINWAEIPAGNQEASLTITNSKKDKVRVKIKVNNPSGTTAQYISGFVESNDYISIEAEHFLEAYNDSTVNWQIIPSLGRTLSGVTALPTTFTAYEPGGDNPRLEYPIYLFAECKVRINVFISPTLNYYNNDGLKYGISIDDQPVQIVSIHANDTIPDWQYPQVWNQSVADNIRILTTEHSIDKPGGHLLKIWLVTPGVVLQKIVIDAGGMKPCYLGPPESYYQVPR